MSHRRQRWIAGLALALVAVIAALAAAGPERLLDGSNALTGWTAANPLLAGGLFLLFATLGKVTPVPGGVPVMLSAGFLFGPVVGPALASLGSALAAAGVTAVGRWVFPEAIARFRTGRLARYEAALARDGVLYLAAIRILPVVPAWVGNLLPVAVEIRLRWVFLATLVGVAPLTFVVGGIGSRLQDLAEARHFDAGTLFAPGTLLPLLGLTALTLLPIALRRSWRAPPD